MPFLPEIWGILGKKTLENFQQNGRNFPRISVSSGYNIDQVMTENLTSLGDVSQLRKHGQKSNFLIATDVPLPLNIQEGSFH